MSNIFLVVVFLASLLYISMKYRTGMRQASAGKLAAVILPSLLLIAGAMFLVYVGNNWIASVIANMYLIVFIQFIYVLLVLSVCTFIVNLLFKKAANESGKKTA